MALPFLMLGRRPPPVEPGGDGWAVEVSDISNGTLTFNDSDATQIGVYQPAAPYDDIDQIIRRRTIEDWRVDFRREADDSRQEIVVARGSLYSHSVVNEQDPVTVKYFFNGELIATDEPYKFFYRSRIRQVFTKDGSTWSKASNRHRPIVANPATLMAAGLLPPLGETGIALVYSFTHVPYAPMGSAGIVKAMGTTGQTGGVNTGLITGHQAAYLLEALGVKSPGTFSNVEATMFAQAEASASIPWHYTDEATGKPVSVFDRPLIQSSGNQTGLTGHVIPSGGYNATTRDAEIDGWGPNEQSQPSFAYVPALLTGDLFYWEEAQHATCWSLATSRSTRLDDVTPIIARPQGRETAWILRGAFQLALQAPTTDTTGVLLPKAYFQTLLDNTRAYYTTNWVESENWERAIFRKMATIVLTYGGARYLATFEYDYCSLMLGWAVLMGHSDWAAMYDWQSEFLANRMDAEGDWNRFVCGLRIFTTDADQVPIDWSETYATADAIYTAAAIPSWPPPANTLWNELNGSAAIGYAYIPRAGLAMGLHMGKTAFEEPLGWLTAEIIAHEHLGLPLNSIAPQYSLVPPPPE